MNFNLNEYSEKASQFKFWLESQPEDFLEKVRTSKHTFRKIWSLFAISQNGTSVYSNYKDYRYEIHSIINRCLYLHKKCNLFDINKQKKGCVKK